jgi:pilus assembly protein CpaB
VRHRTGLFLILAGIALAAITTLLIIRVVNQATEASRSGIRQVAVVTTTKDILDQTPITADGLVVRAFPADFAPTGALGSIDQAVGKFANGFIAKDQILVAGQLAPAQRSANLSDRVPTGKVAVWLPMPELLVSAGILRPGDHVDILLSIALSGGNTTGAANGVSTQTTLQNVEVFRLGQQEVNLSVPANSTPRGQVSAAGQQPAQTGQPAPGQGAPAAGGQPGQAANQGAQAASNRVIGFLVDHQDAVMIKFIKDSGGTIDLVLRSADEPDVIRTDAITLDSMTDRFRFRVPQQVAR